MTTRLTHTLITGASSGLGLELARLFARDGRPLVLTARSEDKTEALAAVLRKDHEIDVRVMPADLTAPGAVSALLDRLNEEGLGIRALVNNAGFGANGPFETRHRDTYRKLITLNIGALTELAHALLPAMLTEGRAGRHEFPLGILNVASTAAFQSGPGMAVYFASKAYVLSFSEALHEEVRGSGVTVTAFCPGGTRTNFFSSESMVPSESAIGEGGPDSSRRSPRAAMRMEADVAAMAGFDGFRNGKSIVIPGAMNRFLAQLPRFLPRAIVRRITRRVLAH
jgi:uncharacterized protein